MNRRAFISGFSLGLLAAPFAARAQQAGKVHRVGFLTLWNASSDPTQRLAFLNGLHALGYREGRNLALENRFAEGKIERLPVLAAELVHLRVDVIVALSARAGLAATQATSTIPIVIASGGDLVGSGLVAGGARGTGNVTGLQFLTPDVAVKQLDLLKQITGGSGRLAFLGDPDSPSDLGFFKALGRQAPALGVTIRFVEARTAVEQQGAMARAAKDGLDGLLVAASAIERDPARKIIRLAALHRIPTIYPGRPFVEAGGLASYFADLTEQWRHAAGYVDKILMGAKPADLPVEQPTRFELVVNLRTAKALGLAIPRSVLDRADDLIQ